MPLRTTTVGRQRTMSTVAKSIYDVGNDASALERAVAALRSANPHARDDGQLKAGVTLAVPVVPGLRQIEADNPSPPDPRLALAAERAEALRRGAEASFARTRDEARRWQKEAAARETADAMLKARPDLQADVAQLREKAAERVARLEESAKRFDNTMESLLAALRQRR